MKSRTERLWCIRVGYAHKVPNINGPINCGSCQFGKLKGEPVAEGSGVLVGSVGGSAMGVMFGKTRPKEEEGRL